MKTIRKKRSYHRCAYNASIGLSSFNSGQWLEAESLDHCKKGMCIKSNINFRPGTTLLIRVKNYPAKGSCPCAFEGLPSMTLGEVKWCRETPDSIFSSFKIGVKYFTPDY